MSAHSWLTLTRRRRGRGRHFGPCAMCRSEWAYLLVELRELCLGSVLDRHGGGWAGSGGNCTGSSGEIFGVWSSVESATRELLEWKGVDGDGLWDEGSGRVMLNTSAAFHKPASRRQPADGQTAAGQRACIHGRLVRGTMLYLHCSLHWRNTVPHRAP